jgi:hypothetical protein
MNLASANIVVRPRSTRESLDLTLPFLIRVGGLRYLSLFGLVVVPALAACLLCKRWLSLDWAQLWLLAVPLGLWLQGIFTLAAGDLMFTERLSSRAVLGKFLRRVAPYTAALLLTRALVGLAALTLVSWPWVWSRLLFAPEALLLEGASVTGTLRRAARLGEGKGAGTYELVCWMVVSLAFGVLAAEALGHGIVSYTLQLSVQWGDLGTELGSLYALSGWFAAIPVAATLRFLRYIDARTRFDAWDVQIKMQNAAHVSAAS